MSALASVSEIITLFRGRWQIPLALLGAAFFAWTIVNRNQPPPPLDMAAVRTDLELLVAAGREYEAANAAESLLLRPTLDDASKATLHEFLARLIYRVELRREKPNVLNVRRLVEHQQEAARLGVRSTSETALRNAQALEWLGDLGEATRAYRNTLQMDPAPDERRAALQALVRLLDNRPSLAAERNAAIRSLLAEEGVSPGYLWWAIQQALRNAIENGRIDEAQGLVDAYAQRFERSDLSGYADYLRAWIAIADGRFDEVPPLLARVEGWLDTRPPIDAELDRAGPLSVLVEAMHGRLALSDWRPQEALARFDAALRLESGGEQGVLSSIGRGQALALLERVDASLAALRQAASLSASDPTLRQSAMHRVRRVAEEIFNQVRADQSVEAALPYIELALEHADAGDPRDLSGLLETLGQARSEAAGLNPGRAAGHELAAGQAYERAADLEKDDDARAATLIWSSAQAFDRAGRLSDARRMLERFVDIRGRDPRRPRALLELGHAYAADGLFEQAIARYQLLADEYPALEEAARARLSMAGALIAAAQDEARAERLLLGLLEDNRIKPDALVFRDALMMLCDLLYGQARYAEAIGRIENALGFYPSDAESDRLRFLLADAYRRSALALHDEAAAPTGEGGTSRRARIVAESQARFRRAADLYERFWNAHQEDGAGPDLRLYAKLSLIYRGDCLYMLAGDAELDEALQLYRQAAAAYQSEPIALSAQVQITNIYLRQGKVIEAARAVERARWLLQSIPDSAFATSADGLDRAYWENFLSGIAASHLFRDVFASAP